MLFSALAHTLTFFLYWENTYPKIISERTLRDALIADELIKTSTFGYNLEALSENGTALGNDIPQTDALTQKTLLKKKFPETPATGTE